MIAFSEDRVIFREDIEDDHAEGYYIVRAYKGQIGVFYNYIRAVDEAFEKAVISGEWEQNNKGAFLEKFLFDNEDHYLLEVIGVSIDQFSESEKQQLMEGILVYGEDELFRLLANYKS